MEKEAADSDSLTAGMNTWAFVIKTVPEKEVVSRSDTAALHLGDQG
jgi:hypothetical protein